MIKLEGQKIITNYPIIYKLGNTFRFRLISLPFSNPKMTAKLIIKPLINRRRKKKENKLLKKKRTKENKRQESIQSNSLPTRWVKRRQTQRNHPAKICSQPTRGRNTRRLGNLISKRPRCRRKSAMAASSAGNHSTPHNTKPFEFSAVDFPPRISLTADQYNHCSEALSFFKEKLQNKSQEISQEFARLQASRIKPSEMARGCTVALDGVNLSKNRYTDILPCNFFLLFIFQPIFMNYCVFHNLTKRTLTIGLFYFKFSWQK